MSQQQYLKELYRQLNRLNLIIDRKIMLGRTYKLESVAHKKIIQKIRKFRNPTFFDKIGSLFSREYA